MVGSDDFHETRETLVQPQVVPPLHRHQVAEPLRTTATSSHVLAAFSRCYHCYDVTHLVRELVRDDDGDVLAVRVGAHVFVVQQRRHAVRDEAPVLHRSSREVGDGDQVW